MTLFFEGLSAASLIVGVTDFAVSLYHNSQRKKEIVAVNEAVRIASADSKSSEENLRKEISTIRDHASATRAFAESKALRNTVVVSTSDHAQIVKDHRR